MKKIRQESVRLEKIVGGGQALGVLADGKKIFVWGGLPDEQVTVRITKSKSSYAEGIVESVENPSLDRIDPVDPESYLSTSPWQIMSFEAEQQTKAALIAEAFEMHRVSLPGTPTVHSDNKLLHYRNKVEFSWWWDNDTSQLDLAFFQRGGQSKIPVQDTSLAAKPINILARAVRDLLRTKNIEARSLKTLLIRCNRQGECVWQLYVKERLPKLIVAEEADALPAIGGEIIYSDPRSPASRITERLTVFGDTSLSDEILGQPYGYAAESFFQVNLSVYEQSLRDMQPWVDGDKVVDMYSGVGSIGLSIGTQNTALVEVDEHAYREMQKNIKLQNKTDSVQAVLAPSERALEYITSDACVIVDPPRAGLHTDVVERLLDVKPKRIIYLSCNPVTQARDVSLLQDTYEIVFHQGYNFFPRTPHIEHLIVLNLKS